VVSKNHRLVRRKTLDIIELAYEPLVLPRREFRTRGWIDAACRSARIRPNVLLESAAPQTLVAAAATGYGIAVVPSNVLILHQGVRAIPIVVRGASIGTWAAIGWHPQRFLPPYAEKFVEQCVSYAERANPGRHIIKRAPPLRRPKDSAGTAERS
jgi:DNA-binding transcriptional LysR family regulator